MQCWMEWENVTLSFIHTHTHTHTHWIYRAHHRVGWWGWCRADRCLLSVARYRHKTRRSVRYSQTCAGMHAQTHTHTHTLYRESDWHNDRLSPTILLPPSLVPRFLSLHLAPPSLAPLSDGWKKKEEVDGTPNLTLGCQSNISEEKEWKQ